MQRKFGIAAECLGITHKSMELIRSVGFESTFTCVFERREVLPYRKEADKFGLSYDFIHAPFKGINSMWLEGEEYLEIFGNIKESILCAGEYRIPIVCLHVSSGWTPPSICATGIGRFEELFELGYKKGVRIAIENQRSTEYLAFFMDKYKGNSTVGFCYDSGHEHCFSGKANLLDLYGDRLICTHIHDNNGRSRDRCAFTDTHLLPFDGSYDFGEMKASLERIGYGGALMLEVSKDNKYFDYKKLSDEEYLRKSYDSLMRISLL